MKFSERYSRQTLFQPIGEAGQERLAKARVAVVGCGATGSALASLLARAGVGYLRIIDRDYVEPSNLQRQVLFDEADAAESLPKAIAAARKITAFNSEIAVEPHVADLTPENVEELLSDVDIILDEDSRSQAEVKGCLVTFGSEVLAREVKDLTGWIDDGPNMGYPALLAPDSDMIIVLRKLGEIGIKQSKRF